MTSLNNPTAYLSKSLLWGFEISHLLIALVVTMSTHVILQMMGVITIIAWGLGAVALISLRVLSLGQKQGHAVFLALYLTQPRIYLGHARRPSADKRDKTS